MPSSVRLGSRPSACSTRSYSSGESPCWATTSGVMAVASVMARPDSARRLRGQRKRPAGMPPACLMVRYAEANSVAVAILRGLARKGDRDRRRGGRTGDPGAIGPNHRLAGGRRPHHGRRAILLLMQAGALAVRIEVHIDDAVVLAAERLGGLDGRRQLDRLGVGQLVLHVVLGADHDILGLAVAGGKSEEKESGENRRGAEGAEGGSHSVSLIPKVVSQVKPLV